MGGVANGKVFNACELCFRRFIDEAAALFRLRFEKPSGQYCFRTWEAIFSRHSFERGEPS